MAVDRGNDLFIADQANNRVRELNLSTGIITTIAGGGQNQPALGGLATAALVLQPEGVAIDTLGDLFISDWGASGINEVNLASGSISAAAGTGATSYGGDGALATAASLSDPSRMTLDSSGNLYVADLGNNRVRELNHASGLIATVAGNGLADLGTSPNLATAATLAGPQGMVVDAYGNIYFADTGNNVVREVNHVTGVITTIAGTGVAGYNGDSQPATAAELSSPEDVVLDSVGDLFISDSGNQRVREVVAQSGLIITVVGTGGLGFSGDGGAATAAKLEFPNGLAIDTAGDLFVADSGNNRIREVNAFTRIISTYAGGGSQTIPDLYPATVAQLSKPAGIALDSSGDLFIADAGDGMVYEVVSNPKTILSVAGGGQQAGLSANRGSTVNAKLTDPTSVTIDSLGNLYVVDSGTGIVWDVDRSSSAIFLEAGTGNTGFGGDGGQATAATLFQPSAVATDTAGDVFIAGHWQQPYPRSRYTIRVPATYSDDRSVHRRRHLLGHASHCLCADQRRRQLGRHRTGTRLLLGHLDQRHRAAWRAERCRNLLRARQFRRQRELCNRREHYDVYHPESSADGASREYQRDLYRQRVCAISSDCRRGPGCHAGPEPGGRACPGELLSGNRRHRWATCQCTKRRRYVFNCRQLCRQPGLPLWVDHQHVHDRADAAGSQRCRQWRIFQRPAFAATATVQGVGNQANTSQSLEGVTPTIVYYAGASASGTPLAGRANGCRHLHGRRQFPGSTDYLPVTTTPEQFLISPAQTTVTLSASVNTSGPNQPITLTAAVQVLSLNLPAASDGVVSFLDGSTLLGTVPVANGTATLTTSALSSLGPHVLHAVYFGSISESLAASASQLSGAALITTVAGNLPGASGDGGPATAALLTQPEAVVVDSVGDIFIADTGNSVVREINGVSGVMKLIAGNYIAGNMGDGGAASNLELNHPVGLALDNRGDLFIADTGNNVIRELNLTTDRMDTVVGVGIAGYGGDGGLAVSAFLNDPTSVAVDSSGNLFIADTNNNCIRVVNAATGIITTIAGTGASGYNGDSLRATGAC